MESTVLNDTLNLLPTRAFNSASSIHPWSEPNPSKIDISLKYEELQDLRFEDITIKLDQLWKVPWPLQTSRIGCLD
ncbi:hypothetical protein RRG08_012805 [Elysia crispata]|uniref:Uncharacterized protein n=1 Tax=Elysia crispata TaxID=231223 RepID=A0AAE0Z214_9GAST|nr:hypothetical protein RRG08_012805 [Elysia crispata]